MCYAYHIALNSDLDIYNFHIDPVAWVKTTSVK